MNRKQIDLEDAVGKTIEAVAESHRCGVILLAVEGAEFILIEADGDEDGATISGSGHVRFSRAMFGINDLKKVFDAQTIAGWAADDAQVVIDRKSWLEAEDRKRFEELKAKFDP